MGAGEIAGESDGATISSDPTSLLELLGLSRSVSEHRLLSLKDCYRLEVCDTQTCALHASVELGVLES